MHLETSPAAMLFGYINAAGYFMAGDSSLAVYLSTGSRDLLKLFVEDISIIASLFNCEPRNTQAEVMSPSLVAKYHLFASGCMENASWLEVFMFRYLCCRNAVKVMIFTFFLLLFSLKSGPGDSRIIAANVSARSPQSQTEMPCK